MKTALRGERDSNRCQSRWKRGSRLRNWFSLPEQLFSGLKVSYPLAFRLTNVEKSHSISVFYTRHLLTVTMYGPFVAAEHVYLDNP